MILIEQTSVPTASLPVAAFRDHLRLGTGFSDVALQDAVLETCLRAALSAIEGRTGKALLARDFLLTLTAWRNDCWQGLPIAPVNVVTSVAIVDGSGTPDVLASDTYYLEQDAHAPRVIATGTLLPSIPKGGSVEITMTAGLSQGWTGLPGEIQQAVFLLAADFYENRNTGGMRGQFPIGVAVLIERYRALRVGLGGAK